MPDEIPKGEPEAVEDADQDKTSETLQRVSATVSHQFDDIVANGRWFTTIVIAEIAGIVKFAETSHGGRFILIVIALILLALAAALLIGSIVWAQRTKATIETHIIQLVNLFSTYTPSAETSHNAHSVEAEVLKATGPNSRPVMLSSMGLGAFFFGTLLAGVELISR